MRAVVADHPGGPEVLRPIERNDPLPGHGQVRIAVEFAAITFIDTQLRAGTAPGPAPGFPVVLGNGVGGRVDAVGTGEDSALMGMRVVATTGGLGGYASSVVTETSNLHDVPDALGLDDATAVLADGRTALALTRGAALEPGDVAVITAAAGGVGTLLVQLAAAAGAEVIALAGSERKLAHACLQGAHHAIDYRSPHWESELAEAAPNGTTAAFDGVGGTTSTALSRQMRPGSRYLQFGAASGDIGVLPEQPRQEGGIITYSLADLVSSAEDNTALVDSALDHAARRLLRPTIGQTYPLNDAAAAHADIEARHTIGKTLLLP